MPQHDEVGAAVRCDIEQSFCRLAVDQQCRGDGRSAFVRDRDRGLQRLLGRRGIGRVALQQDPGADSVHLRFVPALLGAF